MANNVYALIRVSTDKQNEKRQVIEMTKLGIHQNNIVIEKESGKSTARAKYKKLVKRLKEGDVLYIENIDRLARDYDTILKEWNILTKQKGIIIRILDTPMLNTDISSIDLLSKFNQDILLLIQAFQAENEWQKIKSRQAQGIAAAKASGKKLGRPKRVITEAEISVVKQYQNKDITLDTALKLFKLKKTAFYNLCNAVKNNRM